MDRHSFHGGPWMLLSLLTSCATSNGTQDIHTTASSCINLRNANLSVEIDASNGSISGLTNLLTGERHRVESVEFGIVTTAGEATYSDEFAVRKSSGSGDAADFELAGKGYQVKLHYRLGASYLEKWLEIVPERQVHLDRILVGSRRYTPRFQDIRAHGDNTVYNVPINWFLRTAAGGWYSGVAWPFTEGLSNHSDRLSLTFGGWHTDYDKRNRGSYADIIGDRPFSTRLAPLNVLLASGQPFVTEKEFLGVYKKSGYLRKKEIVGIPRILTTASETLDWGEVWAMQEYMDHALPPLPQHHKGYWYYLNGWWAGTPGSAITPQDLPKHLSAVNQAKELGAEVYALSPTWMGMAKFFDHNPEFIRTLGKDGSLPLSPEAQQVVRHTEACGLTLAPYCEGASYYREDRPDWKVVLADGTPRGELCWANPAAVKWYFDLFDTIFSQHKVIRYWGWDGGWLPTEPNLHLPWECMSDAHGHKAGNIGYLAYKNVLEGWRRLRQKHPDVGLITAWAHKAGSPWADRDLDVVENFYENPGPDDLRFQAWFMQNSSFIPARKNMAQIWYRFEPRSLGLSEAFRSHWIRFYFEGYRDYRYGLMSALSIGSNVGFIVQFPSFKSDTEKREYLDFMKKWKDWASENIDLLQVKRDLFGAPLREGGIDGSAHCIGDKGFIFLFNPTQTRKAGRIPLNELIGLKGGGPLAVSVIFPDNSADLGTYGFGDKVVIELDGGECKLLKISPGPANTPGKAAPAAGPIQDAFE